MPSMTTGVISAHEYEQQAKANAELIRAAQTLGFEVIKVEDKNPGGKIGKGPEAMWVEEVKITFRKAYNLPQQKLEFEDA